jgi:hypothetical protein
MPFISSNKKRQDFFFFFLEKKKQQPKLESRRCKAASKHGCAAAMKTPYDKLLKQKLATEHASI